MLVLSRRKNESIIINDNIKIILTGTEYNLAFFEVKYENEIKEFKRATDEYFNISKNIRISIVEIFKDKVRLGIDAPKEVSIYREEIYNKIKKEKSRQFTSY